MLSRWERWVLFYDFVLKPIPEEAPDIPLDQVLGLLAPRQRAGLSVKLINNDTAAIRIQKMAVDEEARVVAMLINYSDMDATDPVFGELQTGKLRLEPKLEGEGIALSAHLVISLDPSPTGAYPAVIEDVPGVGRTKLLPFLTSEFREVSTFEFETQEGRRRRCRPGAEMVGHPAQRLRDDLKRGYLSGIELQDTRVGTATEFDELPGVTVKHRSVVFKIDRSRREDAVDLVNEVARYGRERGYNEIRVRFRQPEGRQRTVPVPTLREDIGDFMYARNALVAGFEVPMEQSCGELRMDLIGKMIELLGNP